MFPKGKTVPYLTIASNSTGSCMYRELLSASMIWATRVCDEPMGTKSIFLVAPIEKVAMGWL